MNGSAPKAAPSAVQITIRITQGPDQGDAYRISPPGAILGRDPNLCQITFTDVRVSRQQCRLDFKMEGLTIEDLSGKGTTHVNLQPIQGEFLLSPGDTVSFGETSFIIENESSTENKKSKAPTLNLPALSGVLSFPQTSSYIPQGALPQQNSTPPANKRVIMIIAVGLIVGLGLWMIPDAAKNPPPKIATPQDLNDAIVAVQKRQEELQKATSQLSEIDLYNKRSAQKHYIRGFRDYQNGQYSRAMEAFQTTLATDPRHKMARRYYALAEKKREEMVDFHMDLGNKYKQKNMYNLCIAEFEKVLQIINQPSKKKYQLSKEQIKECRLSIQGSL